jgi:hypothetical protein
MKKLSTFLFIAILILGCKKGGVSPADKLLISSETITNYYPNDSTLTFKVNLQYNANYLLQSVDYIYATGQTH